MTSRGMIGSAVLVLATVLCLFPRPAFAQSRTIVTGAGSGSFPVGAAFNGVSLSGLRFGLGVSIAADGTARGDFEGTLLATLAGQPNITVEGKVSAGSVPSSGSGTFSGACSFDMGNGTPPLVGVPFVVSAAGGSGTLTIQLGLTSLPTATVRTGSLTVK
jgi:hypothetical protein